MRRFFSFWWLCVRTAFRGNSAFANDWQWLFGIPLVSGLYVFYIARVGGHDLTTGYPIADAFLAALAAFIATWLIAFAIRLANAPVSLYYEEKRKADLSTRRIEILFPDRCNSPATESLFKRSWSPLCKEGEAARRISFHSFYLGVQNPSNEKTFRNVRVVMESLSFPGQILNMACVCDRTQTDSVDIPPGAMDYFLIGEGVDGDDGGMFRPKLMARSEYDELMANVDSKMVHSNFSIRAGLRAVPLLKNDGYRVDIVAYADDTPPTSKTLIINAKTRIEMHLEDAHI